MKVRQLLERLQSLPERLLDCDVMCGFENEHWLDIECVTPGSYHGGGPYDENCDECPDTEDSVENCQTTRGVIFLQTEGTV